MKTYQVENTLLPNTMLDICAPLSVWTLTQRDAIAAVAALDSSFVSFWKRITASPLSDGEETASVAERCM
jgi:hypothetical protein